MSDTGGIPITYEKARRFYEVIRTEKLDIGDAARRANIQFHEACEIWAKGVAAKRLRIADDYPGFRYIEEIRPE